ncbi:hypothetical protein K0U00_36305, partial [Paenibacillus sepulcri]|nr:hypothetical protein [Paenibacillus sepulcri]
PLLYPGQTIEAQVMVPEFVNIGVIARLYVKDVNADVRHYADSIELVKGEWITLRYKLPSMENVCIGEAGIEFVPAEGWSANLVAYVDDFHFSGAPDYAIDFGFERIERWHGLHQEVSQFTYLRGLWTLEQGELSGSYSGESAECYTGDLKWRDYEFEAVVRPVSGSHHRVLVRVQGGIRSYAAGLAPGNKVSFYKNANGCTELASADFEWEHGRDYTIAVEAMGNRFTVSVNGQHVLEVEDAGDNGLPYWTGQVGLSNTAGSHTHYKRYRVSSR